MRPFFTPVCPSFVACKCCGATSPLFGVVDFHKNCNSDQGAHLPLSGIPIYYHRCPVCRFLFSTAFDHFTPADFGRHIYNHEYIQVDPEFPDARPRRNAEMLARLFHAIKPRRCPL